MVQTIVLSESAIATLRLRIKGLRVPVNESRLPAFRELAALWVNQSVELFTYTYSTSVRAAMLAARFYVAKGRATGPKAETTIGLTSRAAAATHDHELLGLEWLSKWRRSGAQMPLGAGPETDWRAAVEGHPQFDGLRIDATPYRSDKVPSIGIV